MTDDELDGALRSWHLPTTPLKMEARALTAYRKGFRRTGTLRRWLTMSVRVPAPLAAMATMALLLLSVALARAVHRVSAVDAPRMVVQTRTVEVPVIQERVVIRTVYREPKAIPHHAEATVAADLAQADDFVPVGAFAPRIIRSGDEPKY
jgi:hypothetical protein